MCRNFISFANKDHRWFMYTYICGINGSYQLEKKNFVYRGTIIV